MLHSRNDCCSKTEDRLRDRKLTVSSDGETRRDFSFGDDCYPPVLRLLFQPVDVERGSQELTNNLMKPSQPS